MREVVYERTGQAVGQTDFVADQATAVLDELRQGAHGGALGAEGGKLVAVFEEDLDLEFGIGGVIFGPARGKRFTVLGHGERIDGKEHEEIIGSQCGHDRPFREFQAHTNGLSVEARAESLDPGINLFRTMFEAQKLPLCGASGLEADIVFRISQSRPTKAANASDVCCFMCDLSAYDTVVPRDMPACALRR